jgi:adenosylcobinamide kinase/adenosylcobinamide-phosphate guanylyltransferase
MKLVIGGAFQGKTAYARQQYQMTEGWVDGASCPLDAVMECRGIYHFHTYLRRRFVDRMDGSGNLISIEEEAEQFAEELAANNPQLILVSDEVGYGVVPMEKSERIYREIVGRVCTCIAARSDEVTRVICGVGTRLK